MAAPLIAKAVPERGSRTGGLVAYLFGPGRFNEHTNPRVVAAWDPSFVRSSDDPPLDRFEQQLIAREMEAPMRLHDIEMGEHVYHVPVSIEAEAGALSDEQWQQVAMESAEELGFTEAPGRAAVPWIAVRHGLSEKGNDHIHFVAVLHREDGTGVDTWNDWEAWRKVRHAAEDRWNLRSTRKRGGGLPDLKRGELERAKREGKVEPERVTLARTVRAAATAARSEGDFVHRLRHAGVIVRPRWSDGGQQQVIGYSVALRPEAADDRKPVWFGGGKLATDLTLPRLREEWGTPTEEQDADTRRAWRPKGWKELPTGRQIQRGKLRAEAWQVAGEKVAEVRARLATVDPADRATWAAVAHEAAGALGALAGRVDLPNRAQLRRASTALARAAQTDRGTRRVSDPPLLSPLGGVVRTATDALLATHGGPLSVAALVMQLGRLVQEIQRAAEEARRAAEAQAAERAARELLDFVQQTPRPGEESDEQTPEERRRREQAREFGEVERPNTEMKEDRSGRER